MTEASAQDKVYADSYALKHAPDAPLLPSANGVYYPANVVTDKGQNYYQGPVACSRCGGYGNYSFNGRHSICYRCNGRKYDPEHGSVRLYSENDYAKLVAKREAKAKAKYAQLLAEREANWAAVESLHGDIAAWIKAREAEYMNWQNDDSENRPSQPLKSWIFASAMFNAVEKWGQLSEKQVAAVRSFMAGEIKFAAAKLARENAAKASQHVGKVGDKLEVTATIEAIFEFESRAFSGYGTTTTAIYKMRDGAGNSIVWKGQKYGSNPFLDFEKGATVTFTGRVKEHSEYKGEKQTRFTHVKIGA